MRWSVLLVGILVPSLSNAEGGSVRDVEELLDRSTAAVVGCDIEAYSNTWSSTGTIFISSGNPLMPTTEYLQIWGDVCKSGGGILVEPIERQINLYGETALVTGLLAYEFTDKDGARHAGKNRYTTVVINTEDGWKIQHGHISELGVHVVENP